MLTGGTQQTYLFIYIIYTLNTYYNVFMYIQDVQDK